VVVAIAGSVLLVMHRSSDKASARPGSAALPRGGKVIATIPVGHGSLDLGKGGGPMAVGEDAVWAMSNAQSTLMRIDPARNTVVAKIKVDPPETVAAGDGAVWLSNPSDDTVSRVDPATDTVIATIPVGPEPEGIAVSPGAVWVVNAGDPSVSRIDPATNRVVKTIPIGSKRVCCAEHTYLTAVPGAVWVALPYANRIVRIDPTTNKAVATAKTGYSPSGFLAADRAGVWSAGVDDSVVARIDSRTDKPTAQVAEVRPTGLVIAFGSVWVAATGGDVDRIDPHSGRLVARLHVGGFPVRLGVGFGSIWVNDDFGRVLRIKPQL
jgi:YVTN family beta-propeller protein